MKKCFDRQTLSGLAPQVRLAVVYGIGAFERQESLDMLIQLLEDESYFVEQEAAIAIGKCGRDLPPSESSKKKMEIVDRLKNLVDNTKTFQNLLAQGAINGLLLHRTDSDYETNVYLHRALQWLSILAKQESDDPKGILPAYSIALMV